MYVFIRKDLPIEQIVVQVAHAALESGIHLSHPTPKEEPSSLIVLQVKDQKDLEKAFLKISENEVGIDLIKFFEPSWDYGFTSFATSPVKIEDRNLFKKYRLFKGAS